MNGTQLGSWLLQDTIGRGGMGTVYRARRVATVETEPQIAAIKILAAELAVEVGFQQRFQREIDILSKLNHPHIVQFLESGVENGRFWFAMELIDGESYEDILAKRGRLDWREVLELAWQITPAMKHAHDRGVIHRDIKPSNLMSCNTQDRSPLTKLTDFGIASLFASPHLTITGGVIGTPEYLSPEQAAGKPVTRRSDLYSLGVVLYTLITGRTPFEGEHLDLLHKHRFAQFDRPSRFVPSIHHDLEEIICELLAKEPEKRPSDAGVLHRRLDSLKRKLERKTATQINPQPLLRPGEVSGRPGPATLMSQLMREELDRENRGGPVRRFVNHPVVIVILFVLCVSTLAYTLWPASPGDLFNQGAKLMASTNPEDWETAWEKYLTPLEEKYPEHEYKAELDEFRQRRDEYQMEKRANRLARTHRRLSEGQWFYERGLRLAGQGNREEARKIWKALIAAYAEVPSERPWVKKAESALDEKMPTNEAEWVSLEKAIDQAKELEKEGKPKEATRVREALKRLYADNPEAMARIMKK